MFLLRWETGQYLYQVVDQHGQVVDVPRQDVLRQNK